MGNKKLIRYSIIKQKIRKVSDRETMRNCKLPVSPQFLNIIIKKILQKSIDFLG